jgi:hypothetical protein
MDGRASHATGSWPSAVAGIRLVDSKIARQANELSRSASTPCLFNHCVRTFLWGSLTGRANGQRFDEELLYLACLLHDLGLTDRYQGEAPFEIQGAEAARRLLKESGLSEERAEIVWDGIAMHTLAISEFKRPEIALVGAGAGVDVLGADPGQIDDAIRDEILKTFPRLGFKQAFVRTCADVVRKHPIAASQGFMHDVRDRYLPEFHSRNFCDRIAQAPYLE